jgi:CDP-diacylglycerol--serine O-phosphatidyltransferase
MRLPVRAPYRDFHVSHGLTYMSLACGIAAIAAGPVAGGAHIAGACLALAALADTFDGRFARLFQRTERQADAGGQLDSLVDACVFGIAPIAVLATHAAPPPGAAAVLWWLAAFAYCMAVVTRLGFFNVEGDRQAFVGVPTPAVALVWSTVLLSLPSPPLVTATYVAAAAAMVAPVVIPRPRAPVLALFAAWAAALLWAHAVLV